MAHPTKQRGRSTSKEASRSGYPSTPSRCSGQEAYEKEKEHLVQICQGQFAGMHYGRLKRALAAGIHVNEIITIPDHGEGTILLWAVEAAHEKAVRQLIDHGANVDAQQVRTEQNGLHLLALGMAKHLEDGQFTHVTHHPIVSLYTTHTSHHHQPLTHQSTTVLYSCYTVELGQFTHVHRVPPSQQGALSPSLPGTGREYKYMSAALNCMRCLLDGASNDAVSEQVGLL
jgi:hypothetical protein